MENPLPSETVEFQKLRDYLEAQVGHELAQKRVPLEQEREFVAEVLNTQMDKLNLKVSPSARQRLYREILDDLAGLGPLQPLLEDPDVTEILVNRYDAVYVERNGQLYESDVHFAGDDQVMDLIRHILLPLGLQIDAVRPLADARLADGSRVNAVIPPVAVDGPSISIRKFQNERYTGDELVRVGSMSPYVLEFLRACVQARLNIIVSGGTSSGKTTLLNALSAFIPQNERIVTIEDAAELRLKQRHVVRLEARPPDLNGRGEVTVRSLVRNALRMRPDRILVGEVRGAEALDMLQAMNTGHEGSLTTLHANSPRDVISRLETMVLMAGFDLPSKNIRQQISSAINLIVHLSRLRDGTRRVVSLTEISGMEGDTVVMSEIFRFEQKALTPDGKVIGELKPTGIRPMFSDRLEAAGFRLGGEFFGADLRQMLNNKPRR